MQATLETIKIEMSVNDSIQLREQILAMIKDIETQSEALVGYFDEPKLRENYPKINEFLGVLDARNEMPF